MAGLEKKTAQSTKSSSKMKSYIFVRGLEIKAADLS
jgi:hypothetical protein